MGEATVRGWDHPEKAGHAATRAALESAFGDGGKVYILADNDVEWPVTMTTAEGLNGGALFMVSTLDLHGTPNPFEGEDARAEVVMMGTDQILTERLVYAVARSLLADGSPVGPGCVYAGLVGDFIQDAGLPHLLLAPVPFGGLDGVPCEDGLTASWVLGMPIGDAELSLAQAEGMEALLVALSDSGVEYWDLERESVA